MQANIVNQVRLITRGGLYALLVATFVSTLLASSARAGFGIKAFDQQITANAAGESFTQAGGHPYAIVTEIALNTYNDPQFYDRPRPEGGDAKDILVEVPPGLFGNPVGIPQCSEDELAGDLKTDVPPTPECPVTSIVGTIHLETVLNGSPVVDPNASFTFPLFNMVPPSNMPAQFGFNIGGVPITLSGNVRDGGDFGVTVGSTDISTAIPLDGITLTFWGNPSDPSHDAQRCVGSPLGFHQDHGDVCEGTPGTSQGPNPYPAVPKPFLTVPVSCTAPGEGIRSVARIDSWQHPNVFVEQELFSHEPPGYPLDPPEWGGRQGMTGCELIPFKPSISVETTNHQADTPTGLNIDFKLPQDGLLSPNGISTSEVKKTVVTLPAGVSVSPSAAQGLGACSLAQIGLGSGTEPSCPESSKIGTIEIDTPLLGEPLMGSIYLAKQNENPFGSLIAIYLVAQGHGVVLKLAGRVDLDPVTGQLVTTVDNSPELPFEDLKVDFKGGPRSPLVNPHTCGTYTTHAVLTPWSGNAPVDAIGSFQVTSGPNGSPCPAPQQFTPGFAVGTTNNQAGAFSPLSLTMTRADGDQQLGGVTIKTPTGLLGTLSSVALCGEPQASLGTCGADSQIGTLLAGSGAGPNPLYVTGGRIYITGPYKGSPFGLSVVVPAVAGPFNLGTVVVRGAVSIDPQTAALTVTTDPLPTILDGIPLDLRLISVNIDRPSFIFNPTDCNPMSITGTLTGGQGLVEPVSSRFQVTNCAILGFKPRFNVSTSGKTSRANGASLDVKLAYPARSMGKQSNIAKVKVDLPKQLPSRLTTLQKACPAATFDANPALCPVPSRIGMAIATTPVLPVPLNGPVYFVSHGGESFPDLVIVLQGYGVTVELVGTTFINKTGITSSTFKTVPDVPVSTFELKLPQGPYSALAANGNLCKAKLKMPTAFVAQDGAEIHQSTPITVNGCARHKKKGKASLHKRKRKHVKTH
jgi:hypothetical protein